MDTEAKTGAGFDDFLSAAGLALAAEATPQASPRSIVLELGASNPQIPGRGPLRTLHATMDLSGPMRADGDSRRPRLGQEEEARSTIRAALELVSPEANPYTSSRTGLRVLAQIDARYGRMDDALALVSREIAAGYWKRSDLQFDPDWTLLRRDPRFRAIAEAAPL